MVDIRACVPTNQLEMNAMVLTFMKSGGSVLATAMLQTLQDGDDPTEESRQLRGMRF